MLQMCLYTRGPAAHIIIRGSILDEHPKKRFNEGCVCSCGNGRYLNLEDLFQTPTLYLTTPLSYIDRNKEIWCNVLMFCVRMFDSIV